VLITVGDALLPPSSNGEDHLRSAMIDCVRKLNGDTRKVVQARYGDGTSCEDIATSVGRSVQGIYAILKRARTALADCVKRIDPSLIRECKDV
jgi:RNA polymerase sigma-70 factor (ECF subfamily)